MSRPRYKARGQIGSWFADVNGEQLACCHKHWLRGFSYHDPFIFPHLSQTARFVEALMTQRKVVLTKDEVLPGSPPGFNRQGYLTLCAIDDVKWEGSDLRFTVINVLADLE